MAVREKSHTCLRWPPYQSMFTVSQEVSECSVQACKPR